MVDGHARVNCVLRTRRVLGNNTGLTKSGCLIKYVARVSTCSFNQVLEQQRVQLSGAIAQFHVSGHPNVNNLLEKRSKLFCNRQQAWCQPMRTTFLHPWAILYQFSWVSPQLWRSSALAHFLANLECLSTQHSYVTDPVFETGIRWWFLRNLHVTASWCPNAPTDVLD